MLSIGLTPIGIFLGGVLLETIGGSATLLLIATGVLSVIFGLILIAQPGLGLVTLLYVIGIYAIIDGILLIMLSFLRRMHSHPAR